MNSDEQIPREQVSQELTVQKFFRPALILATLVGAIVVVYNRLKLVEEDIDSDSQPPIIIKSGSFTIETDADLTSLPSPGSGKHKYKKVGFGNLKGIRVVKYGEKSKEPDPIDDFVENTDWSVQNVRVKINLQYCEQVSGGECVKWSQDPPKTIDIAWNGTDFEITTPFKLSNNKGKNHTKRQAKRTEDDNDKRIFRWRSVELFKNNGDEIKTYGEEDGREYIIMFYNNI